jgi:glycosyltransferase involved in cell wall biosynthesis
MTSDPRDVDEKRDIPLFYVVDWLPPDFGAVGQYGSLFAGEIAQAGRRVYLIGLTSGTGGKTRESFGPGAFLETTKIENSGYQRTRNLRRLLWTLRTNLRLMREVLTHREAQNAELLFTGSPPFMLYFAFLAKILRRTRLTYRITDFFPEVIIASSGKRSVPLLIIQRMTWFFRRQVDTFEVLGEDQRRLLLQGGIRPERIRLKRDVSPVLVVGNEIPAPRPNLPTDYSVLLYSGNYGVAHEVDTVIEGFDRHYRSTGPRFALWLNGTGAKADQVEASLRSSGIAVARTTPAPLEQLPGILAAADAHLITLRSEFAGIVLPSKVYSCIASGRPILFVGPKESDVHLLCSRAPNLMYEQVDPGDAAGFAAALARIGSRPQASHKAVQA